MVGRKRPLGQHCCLGISAMHTRCCTGKPKARMAHLTARKVQLHVGKAQSPRLAVGFALCKLKHWLQDFLKCWRRCSCRCNSCAWRRTQIETRL